MTAQTPSYVRAKEKDREYSYSLVRPRLRRYSKRFILPYFESGVLADLGIDEERLCVSWMKQKIEKEIYKRILSQSITLQESLPYSYNPVADWLQTLEPVIKKPFINVSYINHDSIDNLLGIKGKITLGKVINLIQKEAEKEDWPLTKIEVHYRTDPEVEDWEYLVIVLYYDSSFEDANKYLNLLYTRLDDMAEGFNPDEKDILAELIYIDIRTNNDISSG